MRLDLSNMLRRNTPRSKLALAITGSRNTFPINIVAFYSTHLGHARWISDGG
jgi:hypothetical protein